MAKLVILEGLSRTGKTSISEHFQHEGFKNISVKNKMPDYVKNLPDFYHGMHIITNLFLKESNMNIVLDRSFLSEMVYSKFFGRSTYIYEGDVVNDLLENNDFTFVYLTNNHDTYLKRTPKDRIIYNKNEYWIQRDLFDQYYESLKNRNEDWSNRFVKIDTTENSIENCIHIINNTINNQVNV
jgi:thymidylate kinase